MPIPLPEEIAQKIILLCYFYVVLFPHFKLKIHKILYPHTVLHTIYGGYIYVLFLFCVIPGRGMSYIPTLTTIFRFRITFFTSKSTSKPCSRNLSTTLLSVLKIHRKNYLEIAVFTTLGIVIPHHSNIFRASFHSASNTKFQNCFFYRLCTSKLPMKSVVPLLFPGIIFLQFSSFIFATKKDYGFSP